MILRDYQQEAVNSIFNYWNNGIGRNGLVCAPTGSGKSVIIAAFIKKLCMDYRDVRILVITDSRELISQNEKTMRLYWSDASTGIYSAGLNKRQTQAQITFCGIQSMYNKAFNFDSKIDIICIDEAHMVSPQSMTRYQKFFKDMSLASPDFCVVGFTATPYRLSSGMLHEGKDALFDGIMYVCEVKRLIDQGYLVPLVSKGGSVKIDLKDVHIQAGEYNSSELAHAADSPELVRLAVKEIVECGVDRKSWLIFASGVNHASHVAEEMKKHGIDCEIVTGETKKDIRDKTVDKFKSGKLKCLINVAVFTKGFDVPCCDLIALLTSTKSTGKYVQICGRGMRTFPGKTDCLLLDFGSNVITHGMIDAIDPIRKKNVFCVEKAPPPMKECPKCRSIFHAAIMVCPSCGFEFEIPEANANHGTCAYDGPVLTSQQQPFFVDIDHIYCSRHHKPGKITSLKVEFVGPLDKSFPLWLCLDHENYAKEKALLIVKQFGGKAETVEQAWHEWPHWKQVSRIRVVPTGKFFNVTGIEFKPGQSMQQDLGEDVI